MTEYRAALLVSAFAGVLCGSGLAESAPLSPPPPIASIVARVDVAHTQARAADSAYRVTRQYRIAGSTSQSSDSEVVAEVEFLPPNERSYTIQKSSGNSRGEQVVRHILDQETKDDEKSSQAAAVTSDNYDFSYLGESRFDGHPCYRLGIQPKRKDKNLVVGEALVDQRTFQVRWLEGDLAKTPSWWLKKVHVKMAFSDVQGTWLQTNLQAVADVRIFGPHTLTSQLLDYRGLDTMAKAVPPTARAVSSRKTRRLRKADPAYSAVFTR